MRLNLTPLGVVFTDRLLNSVGAAAFSLDRDFFISQDLVIRTAAGGGGVQLTVDVDYTINAASEDIELSAIVTAAVGSSRNAMGTITVINAAYQACDLYFSGKYVADSLDVEEINGFGYFALSANHTIEDYESWKTYGMTTAAADKTVIMPTLADNQGKVVTFEKVDSGVGEIVLDGEGAEVFLFQGATYTTIRVGLQYQHVTIEATPAGWLILDGVVQPVALEPDIGGGWHIHKETIVNVADLATADPVAVTVTNVPNGTRLISGYYLFNGASANVTLAILDYADETTWDRDILANGGYGSYMHFEIALDTSKRFKYQGSATSITTVAVYLRKYCLGPA
jgi:hypothetical protein